MAAFFMVSGFFAALLLGSRDAATFYRQRLSNVTIPLISGLVLLNPLTLWLIFRHHNPAAFPDAGFVEIVRAVLADTEGMQGPLVWHLHLWFLFSLTFYVLMAVPAALVLRSDWLNRKLDRAFGALPALVIPAAIAICVAVGVVFMRAVSEVTVDRYAEIWLIRVTLSYWPFYLLGMLLFWRRTEWDRIHRIDPLTFALALAAYVLAEQTKIIPGFDQGSEAIRIFAESLVRCAVIFTLLFGFRALLDKQTAVGSFLADSIYTVYIFHFVTIYLIATFIIDTSGNSPWAFFAVAVLTCVVTFSLHQWVIKRSR